MTHPEHTPASSETDTTIPSLSLDATDDSPPSMSDGGEPPDGEPPGGESPDGEGADRSTRARAEPMTVRPLRDRRYVVETEGGTYVVSLDAGTCTCPDHAIRGSRCKHLRRVAMEVTAERVPAPDERVSVCAVCGLETFVPVSASGPALCARHGFDPGSVVTDRETGKRLVVAAVTDERADEYRTDDGRTVAAYDTNADYGDHEPVVEAVYVESLRALPEGRGTADVKRYGFPASRIVPAERARR